MTKLEVVPSHVALNKVFRYETKPIILLQVGSPIIQSIVLKKWPQSSEKNSAAYYQVCGCYNGMNTTGVEPLVAFIEGRQSRWAEQLSQSVLTLKQAGDDFLSCRTLQVNFFFRGVQARVQSSDGFQHTTMVTWIYWTEYAANLNIRRAPGSSLGGSVHLASQKLPCWAWEDYNLHNVTTVTFNSSKSVYLL